MQVVTKTGCIWWAYRHTNGTIHAKRYFDKRDLEEAHESDFVAEVRGPIKGTRDDAVNLFKEAL